MQRALSCRLQVSCVDRLPFGHGLAQDIVERRRRCASTCSDPARERARRRRSAPAGPIREQLDHVRRELLRACRQSGCPGPGVTARPSAPFEVDTTGVPSAMACRILRRVPPPTRSGTTQTALSATAGRTSGRWPVSVSRDAWRKRGRGRAPSVAPVTQKSTPGFARRMMGSIASRNHCTASQVRGVRQRARVDEAVDDAGGVASPGPRRRHRSARRRSGRHRTRCPRGSRARPPTRPSCDARAPAQIPDEAGVLPPRETTPHLAAPPSIPT